MTFVEKILRKQVKNLFAQMGVLLVVATPTITTVNLAMAVVNFINHE